MAYTTKVAIIKQRIPEDDLIQLTDDNEIGAVDSDVVDGVISQQDELINGYLRGRYDVPLDPVPGLVASLAIDLCAYAFYCRRAHIEIPEPIEKSYNNALKLLREIQSGTVLLGTETGEASLGTAQSSGPGRIFDSDTLANF